MNRYHWNLALVETFHDISAHGVRYDAARARQWERDLAPRVWEAQARVDATADVAMPSSMEGLMTTVGAQCCHAVKLRRALHGYKAKVPLPLAEQTKRRKNMTVVVAPRELSWALLGETANAEQGPVIRRARTLAEGEQTDSARAELAALLGLGVNCESPIQVIGLLDRLGLPPKWKRGFRPQTVDGDEEGSSTNGRTSNEEVLLELFIRTGHPVTKAVLEARSVRTALSWLESMATDEDGRIRCCYRNPGSETGRVLAKEFYTGSGGNLQAVTEGGGGLPNFRELFMADPGHEFFRADLRGADGWTVAARCALLGDPTMLEDLRAGVRIPSLLALMLAGQPVAEWDRTHLVAECKRVVKDWRDYAYKKGQHLSNYMGSSALIRRETVRESYAETGTPVDPGLAFCDSIQDAYMRRYVGLSAWWQDVERQLKSGGGTLSAASGQVREFMARRWLKNKWGQTVIDHEVHKEAVAHEPQSVTTFATNLALWRMVTDPENRRPDGALRVRPLLQTHDELAGQYLAGDREWAHAFIRRCFGNVIRFHGARGAVAVVIPFGGGWGASWGAAKAAFVV